MSGRHLQIGLMIKPSEEYVDDGKRGRRCNRRALTRALFECKHHLKEAKETSKVLPANLQIPVNVITSVVEEIQGSSEPMCPLFLTKD
eukprot:1138557-Pelagomonas_calceolata.AAC.1